MDEQLFKNVASLDHSDKDVFDLFSWLLEN